MIKSKIGSDSFKLNKIKQLESEIEEDPSDVDKFLKVGQLYLDLGDDIEAFSWFSKAAKHFPENSLPFIKLGEVLYNRENYKDSFQAFQQGSKIDPKDPYALLGIAKVYRKLGANKKAKEICGAAEKLEPENPKVLRSILHCNINSGQYDAAEQLSFSLLQRKLAEEDESFVRFYQSLIYIRKQLYIKAIAALVKIPETSQYYAKAQHNIALCYSQQRNYKRAIDVFKSIFNNEDKKFKEVREDPQAWINLGLMYEKSKDYKKAYDSYKKANELQNNAWPMMERMKEIFIEKKINRPNLQDLNKENRELSKLKYALYLGCLIPNRYPMIEAATRTFFNDLGIGIYEMEGASCCPAPGVFRSFDVPTWLTLGARNITIAEEIKKDIVACCNGCYGTLLEVNHMLMENQDKKDNVNKHLKEIGKEYKGSQKVKHLIEIMYFEIGLEKLASKIKNKLDLDVAVHYGCHILKPTETKPWNGEFEEPTFFDEMVELTGCRSIEYDDKMMCCGAGGGLRAAVKPVAIDFTREKLENMRKAGAQAIITCCPFCHFQFDVGQQEVNQVFREQLEEPFNIPVIYITQLFDLAYGKDLYDIGLLKPDQPEGTTPFTDTTSIFEKYYKEI